MDLILTLSPMNSTSFLYNKSVFNIRNLIFLATYVKVASPAFNVLSVVVLQLLIEYPTFEWNRILPHQELTQSLIWIEKPEFIMIAFVDTKLFVNYNLSVRMYF